ncbi:hypothetical protein ACHAXR_003461, partial [Thalassiosira sp. AJA248-18]
MMVGLSFVTFFLSVIIVGGASPSVQKKGTTLRSSPNKVDKVGNYEHVLREKQPWKNDKENKLQPRALESSGSMLYYPVWTKGGYCDNDPIGRPPDDGIKLYETVEECCETAFSWMRDNSCLLNLGQGPAVTSSPATASGTGPDRPTIISALMKPSNQPSARNGKQGCPCLNTTSTLASLPNRQCQLPTGETGVHLTLGGSCVPFTYGSSTCLQHDRLYDPICHEDQEHLGESIIPAYCFRPWCYVDVSACMKESEEQVYRSGYFSHESEVDLFYSYSTCNSTADDWLAVEEDLVGGSPAMGGVSIVANVPMFVLPSKYSHFILVTCIVLVSVVAMLLQINLYRGNNGSSFSFMICYVANISTAINLFCSVFSVMFKRDGSGQIVTTMGSEYYDNSIPWEGVYLKYVNSVMEISNGDIRNITVTHRSKSSSLISNGDIRNITVTHRSKASGLVHPSSSYTAAVQDLQDGLVDMAIGPFWITGQRLKMTSFTLPLVSDKTYLVIPRPGTNNSLNDQIQKVLAPFSYELWGL